MKFDDNNGSDPDQFDKSGTVGDLKYNARVDMCESDADISYTSLLMLLNAKQCLFEQREYSSILSFRSY
jgi:hypothetical protein